MTNVESKSLNMNPTKNDHAARKKIVDETLPENGFFIGVKNQANNFIQNVGGISLNTNPINNVLATSKSCR